MTCETPCSKRLPSMNDNETQPTAVSELVELLDSFFPERAALTLENSNLSEQLQAAYREATIARAQIDRTSRLIPILKWVGMLPFALQVMIMTGQILSGLPLRDLDPLLLGAGLLLLIAVHFIEGIFGRWQLGADWRYAFVPAARL